MPSGEGRKWLNLVLSEGRDGWGPALRNSSCKDIHIMSFKQIVLPRLGILWRYTRRGRLLWAAWGGWDDAPWGEKPQPLSRSPCRRWPGLAGNGRCSLRQKHIFHFPGPASPFFCGHAAKKSQSNNDKTEVHGITFKKIIFFFFFNGN